MLSMNYSYLLFGLICLSAGTRICGASSSFLQEPIQIEIITVGNIHSNASLSNLPYIAPGMIVALDQLRQTFGHRVNFTQTLLYNRQYTSCQLLTDNVDFLVAEYYYTRRKTNSNMTVFIGVGENGAAETIFRNKTLYPNVILAGNNAVKSMHNIYTKFFQRFLWTSVYILLDSSATPMHLLLIQNFVSGLTAKGFRVKFANTDMRNPEKINLSIILRDMQIIIVRQVYLAYEPFRHPTFYGNYTWKYGDQFDEPNPFVTAAYEDVILFGHGLEEALNDSSRIVDLSDGSAFARRYWNRTFWLDTGPIEFDEVGERKQPLIIQQFQKGGVWPITVMTLDASANEFADVASISWKVPFPPPNEPACGFLGTNVICWKKEVSEKFFGQCLFRHPMNLRVDFMAQGTSAVRMVGPVARQGPKIAVAGAYGHGSPEKVPVAPRTQG
ncbi:hypothetical protein RvY_16473 [Ramazzottius varieornatus]|uniref:Receptor ligand binding region domain-containing protein n=1 Tax=Ramazzottius varieornatus TaxID=947166 RepID=A0A1D1VYL5_RAMVA|nr:hypothetical protein RvY_16473 [Ramazzottius varieornatus]